MRTHLSIASSAALALGLALVACGGGENTDVTDNTDEPEIDAGPEVDAAPPDAPPVELLLSELDDDGLIAFCEDVTADPDIAEGFGNFGCLGEDCQANETAVEACAAKSPPQPFDCTKIVAEDPFATCDQPVSEGSACFTAFFGQFAAFAAPTCANVAGLPEPMDPATLPECEALAAECPESFN